MHLTNYRLDLKCTELNQEQIINPLEPKMYISNIDCQKIKFSFLFIVLLHYSRSIPRPHVVAHAFHYIISVIHSQCVFNAVMMSSDAHCSSLSLFSLHS